MSFPSLLGGDVGGISVPPGVLVVGLEVAFRGVVGGGGQGGRGGGEVVSGVSLAVSLKRVCPFSSFQEDGPG